MGLSDVKGEKALDLMADVMELAEGMLDDDGVKAVIDGIKDAGGDQDKALRAVLRGAPAIIRDKRYRGRIVSILATVNGCDAEEYSESGDIIGDIVRLLTEDVGALSFLDGSQETAGAAG